MKVHTAPAQSVPFIEKGTMASRTVWHFAYGSYMNRAQMLSRAGNILEERNASLPNYEVRFNKKVRGGTAGANIQMASGKTVHGVLYKVDESALRSLDRDDRSQRNEDLHYTSVVSLSEADFRKQFNSPDEYQQYLQAETHGSPQQVRQNIQRSLLIDQLLKSDVESRSAVTLAEVKAYYDKNPGRFQQPESFGFQSISVMPPLKPTAEQAKAAQKAAEDALRQAKATKSYQDFGLLAEKISQDDFRVNMGDHKIIGRDKLPPQIVKAFSTMQPGQVSGLIQIESAYTIVRLNVHNMAKKQSLQEVKGDLKVELQKSKYEKLRSGLAKQLRAKAKVEEVG